MGKRTTPAARRTARAALGTLGDARVNASTLRRYRASCQQFVDYMHALQLPLPYDWEEMDLSLQAYLEHL